MSQFIYGKNFTFFVCFTVCSHLNKILEYKKLFVGAGASAPKNLFIGAGDAPPTPKSPFLRASDATTHP